MVILQDNPNSGYQYFFRFAELGNGPECNLLILSESKPIQIPAGTVFRSSAGIVVNPNPVQHPLDFTSNISVRIDADKIDGVSVTIRCSDSKSTFSFKKLKGFNKDEINEFTLPYLEIK